MISTGAYLSSLDPACKGALQALNERMRRYYLNREYHEDWVVGINTQWREGVHSAQLEMCRRIPQGASVVEIGCGDGSGANEIKARVDCVKYMGTDLNWELWRGKPGFVATTAEFLPFPASSVDVVLSMFVIEHLVFPATALAEMWRILRPGGSLFIVAPDFDKNAMASERIGLRYGSGRQKLAQWKLLDAFLTLYDSRMRLPLQRMRRRRRLQHGLCSFPILTEPRCLSLQGFTVDCDAVYPVAPEEVVNYLSKQGEYQRNEIYYRDRSTFGLQIVKN